MLSGNPHHTGDTNVVEDYEEDGKVGKKFYPRGLNIVWGSDTRYWYVPRQSDEKPAELLQVCWLEVTGFLDLASTKGLDPKKTYQVVFELSLTPDAFGWRACPVCVMVKRGKNGKFSSRKHNLTGFEDGKPFKISCQELPHDKEDKITSDQKLYFGLYEVWSRKWKGGLKIHNVTVQEVK